MFSNSWRFDEKMVEKKTGQNGIRFKFDDKDLGNMKELQYQSRTIIASLQDLLNQRITEIGKNVCKL